MNSNQNKNENSTLGDEQSKFLEEERTQESIGNAFNEPTPIYTSDDTTLQTDEEYRRDKSETTKEQSIDVSNDDLRETDADRMGGSDRAGTSERKPN